MYNYVYTFKTEVYRTNKESCSLVFGSASNWNLCNVYQIGLTCFDGSTSPNPSYIYADGFTSYTWSPVCTCQEWNEFYWDSDYTQCVKCFTKTSVQRWQTSDQQCCEIRFFFLYFAKYKRKISKTSQSN